MNEEFIKKIYINIVKEGVNLYKELFENTKVDSKLIDYWKNSITLYTSFEELEKKIFFKIIEQIIIDTISSVFAELDGSSNDYNINIDINGINTDNELQDTFLKFIEEKEEL